MMKNYEIYKEICCCLKSLRRNNDNKPLKIRTGKRKWCIGLVTG